MAAFDLHIHSGYSSDGEFSVAAIAGMCSACGLGAFSLTDHNSVRGVGEAAEAAAAAGLCFIPGIEIDCNYRGTDLHLLGYGIDWRSSDFARLEESVAAKVTASLGGMVDNLLRLGFRIDTDAVLAAAGGKLPTGELIAEVMLADEKYHTPLLQPYMEGGDRSDMPYINFYLDYFAQGRPAFVPVEYMDYREALSLVRESPSSHIRDSISGAAKRSPGNCSTAGPPDWRSSTTTTARSRPFISPRWYSPRELS